MQTKVSRSPLERLSYHVSKVHEQKIMTALETHGWAPDTKAKTLVPNLISSSGQRLAKHNVIDGIRYLENLIYQDRTLGQNDDDQTDQTTFERTPREIAVKAFLTNPEEVSTIGSIFDFNKASIKLSLEDSRDRARWQALEGSTATLGLFILGNIAAPHRAWLVPAAIGVLASVGYGIKSHNHRTSLLRTTERKSVFNKLKAPALV